MTQEDQVKGSGFSKVEVGGETESRVNKTSGKRKRRILRERRPMLGGLPAAILNMQPE